MKVTEIQRFCMHDGPGTRTVIFLKGCPLRCSWCHNPETQSANREILFYQQKCIGCGACAAVCNNIADDYVVNVLIAFCPIVMHYMGCFSEPPGIKSSFSFAMAVRAIKSSPVLPVMSEMIIL